MIAVVTGDIVASSKVADSARQAMLARLQQSIRSIGSDSGRREAPAQIFRGDSFQVALDAPESALAQALRVYLAMLLPESDAAAGVELRMGIGVGEISHGGPQDEIGWWSGRAFEFAAAALESLRSKRLALRSPWPEVNTEFDVSLGLLSGLMRRWTTDQHEVLLGALEGSNQSSIAARIGKTQSAVSQRLKLSGWDAVANLLERFELRIAQGLSGHLYEEGD